MSTEFRTIDTRSMQYEGQYEFEYRLLTSGDEEYSIEAGLNSLTDGADDALVVRDVTRRKAEAERIFHMISDGLVTPMTLLDVVYDLIA